MRDFQQYSGCRLPTQTYFYSPQAVYFKVLLMDWSLLIATLNRRDALVRSLTHAVQQSHPPSEVVVIDTSDDWQDTYQFVKDQIFSTYPEINLIYKSSPIRSSATQRNEGLDLCTSDIIFILDDDSFMFPDCAEEIIKIYQADITQQVACIGISLSDTIPPLNNPNASAKIEKKQTGNRKDSFQKRILNTKIGRWINKKILLQSMDELFIKYEGARDLYVPESLEDMQVYPTTFLPGCAITVRRSVTQAEQFDTVLRYYAAFEDLDATYRFGRHGLALIAQKSKLHHFEAASGRIKRKKVIVFQLLNMIIFIKRHCKNPDIYLPAYRKLLWRRLVGEFLKDTLSGRYDFPQLRGVLYCILIWKKVWNNSSHDMNEWYPKIQKDVLEKL